MMICARKIHTTLKDKYIHAFYCPIKNELFLVRETFKMSGRTYADTANSEFYGKDLRVDSIKHWEYLGEV